MKSQGSAYLLAAVLFRVAAMGTALFGLFMVVSTILMVGASGMSPLVLRIAIPYFGAGLVLWFIAKPLASLIARDLGEGPSA